MHIMQGFFGSGGRGDGVVTVSNARRARRAAGEMKKKVVKQQRDGEKKQLSVSFVSSVSTPIFLGTRSAVLLEMTTYADSSNKKQW